MHTRTCISLALCRGFKGRCGPGKAWANKRSILFLSTGSFFRKKVYLKPCKEMADDPNRLGIRKRKKDWVRTEEKLQKKNITGGDGEGVIEAMRRLK